MTHKCVKRDGKLLQSTVDGKPVYRPGHQNQQCINKHFSTAVFQPVDNLSRRALSVLPDKQDRRSGPVEVFLANQIRNGVSPGISTGIPHRNISERSLPFDFRPDMFGNRPRVTSADGKPIELARRSLLGQVAHYRDKLEPGELFGPLYLNVGLGENPQRGEQEWTPHYSAPTTGIYKMIHQVSIHIADLHATGDTTNPEWMQGTLETGSLDFEIVSGND